MASTRLLSASHPFFFVRSISESIAFSNFWKLTVQVFIQLPDASKLKWRKVTLAEIQIWSPQFFFKLCPCPCRKPSLQRFPKRNANALSTMTSKDPWSHLFPLLCTLTWYSLQLTWWNQPVGMSSSSPGSWSNSSTVALEKSAFVLASSYVSTWLHNDIQTAS